MKIILTFQTNEHGVYQFVYRGIMHYFHDGSSMYSGYGSYHWIYLCAKDGENYLLDYEYSDEFGSAVWTCLPVAKERIPEIEQTAGKALLKVYRGEWSQEKVIYHLHPTDPEQVRTLIVPDCTRSGKLTDEDIYGK